jgi:signal transduction histidine kinase
MESSEVIIAIIIATVVLLALAAFFLFVLISYRLKKNKHIIETENMKREFNTALHQSVSEVQETTLRTVGEELHDNVGQLLSSTKMMLGLAERSIPTIPDSFTTASNTLGKAIAELRSISKVLNKEWLKQFNLTENLQAEVKRIRYPGNLQLNMDSDLTVPVNSEEQIILFRIVQEALNNVIKHSEAENVSINLVNGGKSFTISVKDDGKGFDINSKKNGVGMMNMKHRAQLLGGQLLVKSSAKGSEISIELPGTAA